jgi:hypothetical protein
MARQIEEAASANSGIDLSDVEDWAVPVWGSLSEEDFFIIHSMIGGKGLRLGLLEAMSTVIDSTNDPIPSVTNFLTDVAHHADHIWGEVEDKPYIDDENIAYLIVMLQKIRQWMPEGTELTKHEEAMLILMGAVIPTYADHKKYYGDMLRFARARSIPDAHVALQLFGDRIVDRIIEVESILDANTSSLTRGVL